VWSGPKRDLDHILFLSFADGKTPSVREGIKAHRYKTARDENERRYLRVPAFWRDRRRGGVNLPRGIRVGKTYQTPSEALSVRAE